jgi:hypothetical protein
MVNIKIFRAIENLSDCEKFYEGHRRILQGIGVKEVSSGKNDWFTDPYVYVIMVESEDRSHALGGARIHIANPKTSLPIEEATGFMDPNIYKIIKELSIEGSGEVCGLWNSREVAGLGIGMLFLYLAAIAIAKPLGISTLWALCAPYTLEMAIQFGYRIRKDLGKNGTYYYPKLDLVATAAMMQNVDTLSETDETIKEKILNLRETPNQIIHENYRGREVVINYQLALPNTLHQPITI